MTAMRQMLLVSLGLAALIAAGAARADFDNQGCATAMEMQQAGLSVEEIASRLGLSVAGVHQLCVARHAVPVQSVVVPAGRVPSGPVGPAPFGAAGPAPMGAAGPAPIGAAGPPPIGAAGPAPFGAAGRAPIGGGSTTTTTTQR